MDGAAGDPEERALLLEAGAELAAFGANGQSLAFFGLKWSQQESFMGSLEKVTEWGLPIFMSPDSSVLKDNAHLLSSMHPRSPQTPYRRFVIAADRTYLIQTNQLCRTHLGPEMVGGAWRPSGFDLPDESHFVIDRSKGDVQFKAAGRMKASEMESYLSWDFTRSHGPKIELAAYPVVSTACKQTKFEDKMENSTHSRGKWEHLHRLGMVLEATTCARFLIMDTWFNTEWVPALSFLPLFGTVWFCLYLCLLIFDFF